MTKICKTCQVEKPLEDFVLLNKHTGKRVSDCKTCCNKKAKDLRSKDPEPFKKWYEKNKKQLIKKREKRNASK